MNTKLQRAMALHGDSQQDLAEALGLRGYVSIHRKLYGYTGWTDEQIAKVCERYKKSKEELGF